MTAILGYSELLLQQMPSDAAGRADIDEIKKAGDRAAALTRQLLAFSRQQVFEPRVADFNEVVANVEKLLHRVIGEDVELVTELDPAIGHVRVDVGEMEQVLRRHMLASIERAATDIRPAMKRDHTWL